MMQLFIYLFLIYMYLILVIYIYLLFIMQLFIMQLVIMQLSIYISTIIKIYSMQILHARSTTHSTCPID